VPTRPFPRLLLRAVGLSAAALWLLPATASAHLLIGRYESPLPLGAYLGGAAIAVALSFAIVILRSRKAPEPAPDEATLPLVRVPSWFRLIFRVVGLVVWLWVMIQGVVGSTNSDADVGSLFLWTYAWVGIAIVSAVLAPVWEWLDPFRTLHDIGAMFVRRLGITPWRIARYPARLERWPAVGAFVVFVWLELVYTSARGGRTLALAVLLYSAWTLLMMAQYGRETWRRNGDAFTVWFGILNRIAPFGPADDEARTVRARPFGAGLVMARWLRTELILVAVATAAILYDGLSQTQRWFDLFRTPSLPVETVILLVWLAAITALVLLVARVVGIRAMACGIVPIAFGYLIAHYFTALAFDGQRIVNVISDPFNVGWNLFGTADFEPNETYIPYGIVWAVEIVAVVGGHIYGAVMGHRAALRDMEAAKAPAATAAARATKRATRAARNTPGAKAAATRAGAATAAPPTRGVFADVRARQVPLAILMVFLTALTLWSLGQNLVQQAPAPSTSAGVEQAS
jgi:hypothetical protein